MAKSGSEKVGGLTPIKKSMKFQKQKPMNYQDGKNTQFEKYDVTLNGRTLQIEFDPKTNDVVIDNKLYRTEITQDNEDYIAKVNENHVYHIEFHDGKFYLEGRLIEFNFKKSIPKLIRKKTIKGDEEHILAPLPGRVVGLAVEEGEIIKSGHKIITLEAMKMQNDILSSINGKVKRIYVKLGDLVGTNDRLVFIGPESKEA